MESELPAETSPFALPTEQLADSLASALASIGAGSFDNALADSWHFALRRECGTRRRDANSMRREGYVQYESLRSMRSPSLYAAARPGRALNALHHHPLVIAALEHATGRVLEPTRSSYLYYSAGDFMGLHTDAAPCFLTMLVPVAGGPPPLTVFPEFRGMSHSELAGRARRGFGLAEGGQSLSFPPRGFVVLYGNELPHQRGRVPDGAAISVATLCFAAVP